MNKLIRRRFSKWVAVLLLVSIWSNLLYPLRSYALTGGPVQPEFQSYEPAGTTEMVNLFSGDFTYNIPLLEVPGPSGGYPVNLHYHAGIAMDQEASWVGLGWNINPGVLNRTVRGIPDEFNGNNNQAVVHREVQIKPNETYGVALGGTFELFGGAIGLSLGIGVYNNVYKGVGYQVSPGISFSGGHSGSMEGGLGISATIDSQEGVSANASLSLSSKSKTAGGASIGVSYNSTQGLHSMSLGAGSVNANYSFSTLSYIPYQQNEMKGIDTDLAFKIGGAGWGVFGGGYLSGFYSKQELNKTHYDNQAFGYLYLQNANQSSNGTDLMDFNREKDGMLKDNSPNLPIPSLTHDIYAAYGQGVYGMFRPFRNDIGTVFDPYVKSEFVSGALGVDVGIGVSPHIGVNLTLGYSYSESGKWNDAAWRAGANQKFKGKSTSNELYEPYYFKMSGETTADEANELDHIGGENAVKYDLEYGNLCELDPLDPDAVFIKNTPQISQSLDQQERETRSSVISLNNNENFDNGMQVIQSDGSRFLYEIPVYNYKQVEYVSSINKNDVAFESGDLKSSSVKYDNSLPDYKNGFDQYKNRVELNKKYATSFLLTQVNGADYVDTDGNGVPSDGDFGYWVKFKYDIKPHNELNRYKWRAPFKGLSFWHGSHATNDDDKGTYIFGERDVYNLTSIETKSHIAIFVLEDRTDGLGVARENGTTGTDGNVSSATKLKRLKQINLFAKTEVNGYDYSSNPNNIKPLKTVFFEYGYSLCKGIPNTSVANNGKLTLNKVWFQYENSTRGQFSPYEFFYTDNTSNFDNVNSEQNPFYNQDQNDRWGSYASANVNLGYNIPTGINFGKMEIPYQRQFNNSYSDFKSKLDIEKSAWNLRIIRLPSGAEIKIDYETDDYAYVQNKPAMQMFQVKGIRSGAPSTDETIEKDNRKVYFELEYPVSNSVPASDIEKLYLDESKKVYFRVYNSIKGTGENRYDFVSGYAEVDGFGFDVTNLTSEGKYKYAYVNLKPYKIGGKDVDYHPFSVASWQHLRTDLSKYAVDGTPSADGNGNDIVASVNGLGQLIGQVGKVFSGYWKYCFERGWGINIKNELSFIRLKSPDKIKYGGGYRVRNIEINDKWDKDPIDASNTNSIYGLHYDYTTNEGNKVISSGVAAYEPMIGGEENPFRNAKEYTDNLPLATENSLFFELPANESYFPAPSVGYRKVTVMSKASYDRYTAYNSYKLAKATTPTTPDIDPANKHGISGATVHEFYTHKEFPIVTDETGIDKKGSPHIIPIPLIGQITINTLAMSQGYSVELNDMHGRPYRVSQLRQDGNGDIVNEPISSVTYRYNADKIFDPSGDSNRDYYRLKGTGLQVIKSDDAVTSVTKYSDKVLGQDYEFFADARQSITHSITAGFNFNLEVMVFTFVVIPLPIPWPNIYTNATQIRTVSTNKVIHKSGILVGVDSYDEGAKTSSDHLAYDYYTGTPILSSESNNFDNPVYQYNKPAFYAYDAMGPAYMNMGMDLGAISLLPSTEANVFSISKSSYSGKQPLFDKMIEGDEFIQNGRRYIYEGKNKFNTNVLIFRYIGLSSLSNSPNLVLYRSGYRNQLNEVQDNVVGLNDPTVRYPNIPCPVNIPYPIFTPGSETCVNIDQTDPTYTAISKTVDLLNKMLTTDLDLNNQMDYYQSSLPKFKLNNVNISTNVKNVYHERFLEILRDFVPGRKLESTNTNNTYKIEYNGSSSSSILVSPSALDLTIGKNQTSGVPIANYSISTSNPNGLKLFINDGTADVGDYTGLLRAFLFEKIEKFEMVTPPTGCNGVDIKITYRDYYDCCFLVGPCCPNYIPGNVGPTNSPPIGGCPSAIPCDNGSKEYTIKNVKSVFPGNPNVLKYNTQANPPSSSLGYETIYEPSGLERNVLSHTAYTFSDINPADYSAAYFAISISNGFANLSSFQTGAKGSWKPVETFEYVDNRKATLNDQLKQTPNLKYDGIITDGQNTDVPVFNPSSPFNEVCFPKWRKINEIVRYNAFAQVLESKDVLKRYSSALTGKSGRLTYGAATDANFDEIAYEGFEDFVPGSTLEENLIGSSSFTFLNNAPTSSTKKTVYKILDVEIAKGNLLTVNAANNQSWKNVKSIVYGANAIHYNKKDINGAFTIQDVRDYPLQSSGYKKSVIVLDPSQFTFTDFWKGKILLIITDPKLPRISTNSNLPTVSLLKSHTGKKSLKFSQSVSFEQDRLSLIPGKKYTFSAWVSSDNNAVTDLTGRLSAEIKFWNNGFGSLIQSSSFLVKGPMVEGWQQLEGEFSVPENVWATEIAFSGTSNQYFIDDIRIRPSNALMQTYVYNPENYKLTSALDDFNYAELYFYDEEGSLFLKKKETSKGIKTLQESITHIKKRP